MKVNFGGVTCDPAPASAVAAVGAANEDGANSVDAPVAVAATTDDADDADGGGKEAGAGAAVAGGGGGDEAMETSAEGGGGMAVAMFRLAMAAACDAEWKVPDACDGA